MLVITSFTLLLVLVVDLLVHSCSNYNYIRLVRGYNVVSHATTTTTSLASTYCNNRNFIRRSCSYYNDNTMTHSSISILRRRSFQIFSNHHDENADVTSDTTPTTTVTTTTTNPTKTIANPEDTVDTSRNDVIGIDTDQSNTDIYQNVVAKFLSNFMKPSTNNNDDDCNSNNINKNDQGTNYDDELFMKRRKEIMTQVLQLQRSDDYWNPPKIPKLPMELLAQALDYELYHTEWFVTGHVNPIYFSSTNFTFQDPDVKMNTLRSYATGVQQIFDYTNTARAEILSTMVNSNHNDTNHNIITCTWRLSGKVNIGPGLYIKPYIVYTDFTICPDTGLITYQRDRFDIPSWDILLSALFPFVIGRLTSPPAPQPLPRTLVMPDLSKYYVS